MTPMQKPSTFIGGDIRTVGGHGFPGAVCVSSGHPGKRTGEQTLASQNVSDVTLDRPQCSVRGLAPTWLQLE